MINKQNSELEKLIENVGLEEMTERHISDYFTELVKGGNTESQSIERLENIARHAHQDGKKNIAKIIAKYVSGYYFHHGLNQSEENPAFSSNLFYKAAELQRNILDDNEKSERYRYLATILESLKGKDLSYLPKLVDYGKHIKEIVERCLPGSIFDPSINFTEKAYKSGEIFMRKLAHILENQGVIKIADEIYKKVEICRKVSKESASLRSSNSKYRYINEGFWYQRGGEIIYDNKSEDAPEWYSDFLQEARENKIKFIDDLHREINPVIDELKLHKTPELANFSTELKSLLEEIKKS